MSGGSWDYLYQDVGFAADRLKEDGRPERREFGRLLERVANALAVIEWVDSGDKSPPADREAIEECLNGDE